MTDKDYLKDLPSIATLLEEKTVRELLPVTGRELVVRALRKSVDLVRDELRAGGGASGRTHTVGLVLTKFREILEDFSSPSPGRVINGTGIIVHTNLGRAPLPPFAVERVVESASGYSDLEYRTESGRRGSRNAHVESLLKELCGCEAAFVVNNNAAALLLTLAALSRDRETIVSRGQLVEIGGSFRIPEILAQGGARLVEVGTTNRTRIDDYSAAVTDHTALFLMVHRSNFYLGGFVEEVSLEELSHLGRRYSIPVVYDWGSGSIFDMTPFGFPEEKGVKWVIEHGADLVTFSGDKLLGGPQAGIIAGKGDLLHILKTHPIARALRIDKLSLSALNAVLSRYLDWEVAKREIPVLKMLLQPEGEIRRRAMSVLKRVKKDVPGDVAIQVVEERAECGGGALPGVRLKTWCLAVTSDSISPDEVSLRFRLNSPPLAGRISGDRFLIDFRTVLPGEEKAVCEAVKRIFPSPPP